MQQRCADPTFGLNGQALAVLQLLAYRDPEFAIYDDDLKRYRFEVKTFPWYNGRERGICLQLHSDFDGGPSRPQRKCLLLAVAEDSITNRVFIEVWEQGEQPFNCPTVETRTEALEKGDLSDFLEVHTNRKSFPAGQIGKAADYCYDQMSKWYKADLPRKCPSCDGHGRKFLDDVSCSTCDGKGEIG